MHILGHNNLSGHVVGMITGYLIHHMQENEKPIRNSKIVSIFIWCMLPATVYVFFLGNIFYVKGYEVSFTFKLLYAATQRVVAGAIGATIIISLVFKLNNTLCSILEWRGWVIPSRLTYVTFLVHMNIVFVIMGTRMQLGHNSIFVVLSNYVTMAAIPYLIGLQFYLTVEAPIYNMAKTVIDQQDDQNSKMKKN
ncbi:unnamed protein product [Parnassius apollo]|uniref:(apollo) hypothetical protein n=1 Tax=Parnassius apollo TaxID=110799 RepID=A0A8S3XH30_PARAO|nr:unnamed protein product [Parnassius apollo]